MSIAFDYRTQILGAWEDAKGWIAQQFQSIIDYLGPITPMAENLTLPYQANSVLVTDTSGKPAWSHTLPAPIYFNAGSIGMARLNGSEILPNAYITQAFNKPTGLNNQLAHSFAVNTNIDLPSSSSQVIEGYNYYSGTGTTAIIISNLGNSEHGGSGSITDMRGCQGGVQLSNLGGGTHAKAFAASMAGRVFGGTGTFVNGYGFHCGNFGNGFTNKYVLYCADSIAGIFIGSDVAVKATTNTWQVTSDERTKRNVRDYLSGLDVLTKLRPVSYTYNGVGDTPEGVEGIGLIAQEAQPVAPSIVKTRQGSDGETYLTVDSGDLTWMLINAVKELSAKVAALEAKENGVE